MSRRLQFGLLCLWLVAGCSAGPTPRYDKAVAEAKTANKVVLLDFTGSDWCPPCKLLDANVLSTKEFKDYAEKHLVFLVVDFPENKPLPADLKSENAALAKKFDIEGYPTLILLDGEGKV